MTTPSSVDLQAPVLAHHETVIRAPIAVVWDPHTDVNAWPSWQTDRTEAQIDGVMEPGSSFEWTSYSFPVRSAVYEMTEGERALRGGTASGITGILEWLMAETPDGLHVSTTEPFSGGPVDANPGSMQAMLDKSLVAWLAHLKAAAETR